MTGLRKFIWLVLIVKLLYYVFLFQLGCLRGCLISNIPHSVDIVIENSHVWKKCLVEGLKELRSSLTREYCYTIAFFAVKLRGRFMPLVDSMFENLMSLVKNSTKVYSTSATTLSQFFAKYVNNGHLLSITASQMASKSIPVRRYDLPASNTI